MKLLDFLSGSSSHLNSENKFIYGDVVRVKYNDKVGVVVGNNGNYYTVKLKDEFENEYYATYSENEIEKYY